MVALSNFADLVRTAVEEKIDIIFAGAGLPMNLPEFVKGSATKIVPIVSSGRAAALIAKRWIGKYGYRPDAFVVEGPKAGGHLGYKSEQLGDPAFTLETIVPEVIQAIRPFEEEGKRIPVIAGGGVYTGADIRKFLELGASGVQMATRFIATDECDASAAFKQAIVDSKEGDLEIIKSPVGMPGRAVRKRLSRRSGEGRAKALLLPLPLHCHLRRREGALLHFPGPPERAEGQTGQGLRLRRRQRPPRGPHHERAVSRRRARVRVRGLGGAADDGRVALAGRRERGSEPKAEAAAWVRPGGRFTLARYATASRNVESLAVILLEILHEVDRLLHVLDEVGVVDREADAAH